MSYILDALKKADAERERGHIPGLHTQPAQTFQVPAMDTRHGAHWLMASAGLVAVVTGAWWWLAPGPPAAIRTASYADTPPGANSLPTASASRPQAAPSSPAVSVTPPKPVAALSAEGAAAPASTARPQPQPQAPTAIATGAQRSKETESTDSRAPAVSKSVAGADAGKLQAQGATAQITRAPAPESSPAAVRNSAANPTLPAVTDIKSSIASASPPARPPLSLPQAAKREQPRILSVAELPQDVRQTLPKLAISGATYSDNPAWRMIIINGQVVREGEKPTADLQLEQIRPKAAVLNYKGQRYLVGY